MKLPETFYTRADTLTIAKELLGKILYCNSSGRITSGIIVETEAYLGIEDRASHAFGGKYTSRTAVMYSKGGVAYVYRCYGIHNLFNVVTHEEGTPHAVLIRGIEPLDNTPLMVERRGLRQPAKNSFIGPGKVTQALGITLDMTGISLRGDIVWIEEGSETADIQQVLTTPRIGVGYAGKDALLPFRFVLDRNQTPYQP